jgi:spermidine/putrescine transport system ATP-binding protein
MDAAKVLAFKRHDLAPHPRLFKARNHTTRCAPMLEINNITKQFGSQPVLSGISLVVNDGSFFSLLGPSGCGKTTLLRILAGFEKPTSGEIILNGEKITHLPAHKRPFNMVFQQYALFPHKNVFDNIAFGLRMKKVPVAEIHQRVMEILTLVKLQDHAQRSIETLSGGQKQRIAIARAIVNRPKILLLDEPLSALDLKLREAMQVELLNLQRQLKTTFIFVTHDQQEALTLSDQICVMNQGHIEHLGISQDIYEYPKTAFAATFIGAMNQLPGKIKDTRPDGSMVFESPVTKRLLLVKPTANPISLFADTLMVRPEKLRLLKSAPHIDQNAIEATIKSVLYHGELTKFLVQIGKDPLAEEWVVYQLNSAMTNKRSFIANDRVWIGWDPQDCLLLSRKLP